jgi:hypothetical protein
MANIGAFDAELRALAWFDAVEVAEGWFDYGMPFDHPLIDSGVAAEAKRPSVPYMQLQAINRSNSF